MCTTLYLYFYCTLQYVHHQKFSFHLSLKLTTLPISSSLHTPTPPLPCPWLSHSFPCLMALSHVPLGTSCASNFCHKFPSLFVTLPLSPPPPVHACTYTHTCMCTHTHTHISTTTLCRFLTSLLQYPYSIVFIFIMQNYLLTCPYTYDSDDGVLNLWRPACSV